MKTSKKMIAVLLILAMLFSVLPMTVAAEDAVTELTATLDISKVTKLLLHNDYTCGYAEGIRGMICDTCGSACEVLYPLDADNVKVAYTQNENMLVMDFSQQTIAGFECVIATVGATAQAVSGSVVKGYFYHEATDEDSVVHTSQKVPFAFTLTGANLPAYTTTYSTDLAYANRDGWELPPAGTITATIGAREKYVYSLASSYYANTSYTGISTTPTVLSPSFTSGSGLLTLDVSIGAGGIWGGAECELLTFTPTDEAYAITEPTVVEGTVYMYCRGMTTIPFSITINPPKGPISDDVTIASNFGSAVTVTQSFSAGSSYTVALCTSDAYWADMDTYMPGTAVKPYNSNDAFVDVTLTNMSGPIWGGAACIYATFTPTANAALLTESKNTTGYFAFAGGNVFGNGTRQINFDITLTGKALDDRTTDWALAEAWNNYIGGAGSASVQNGSTRVNYNSLAAAINAVTGESKQYLVLLKDYKSDSDVMISPLVNVNLFGHVLDMNGYTLINSGVIRDSEDGVGLVKLSQTSGVAFTSGGGLPIYDTKAGGYRLFSYQFSTRPTKDYSTDQARFSYTLKLTGSNATNGYTLMENGGTRLGTQIKIGWTDAQSQEHSKSFAFTDEQIEAYGPLAKTTAAGYVPVFYIKVSGILEFSCVTATPKFLSTYANGASNGFEAIGTTAQSNNIS